MTRIRALEATHKQKLASSTSQELTQTRLLLLEELNMKTKRQYIPRHKIYYKQGNKSGRLLARAVKKKKSSATVHHIRDKQGTSHSSNEAIAHQFEKYYQTLYNIPSNPGSPHNSDTRKHIIQDFLSYYGTPWISTETSHNQNVPLSEE